MSVRENTGSKGVDFVKIWEKSCKCEREDENKLISKTFECMTKSDRTRERGDRKILQGSVDWKINRKNNLEKKSHIFGHRIKENYTLKEFSVDMNKILKRCMYYNLLSG